jgi:hypothetical protein
MLTPGASFKEVYEIRQEEKLRLSKIRHTGILTVSARNKEEFLTTNLTGLCTEP